MQAGTCKFIKKETLAKVFSCEFYEISNTFSYRTLMVAAYGACSSVLIVLIVNIQIYLDILTNNKKATQKLSKLNNNYKTWKWNVLVSSDYLGWKIHLLDEQKCLFWKWEKALTLKASEKIWSNSFEFAI